MSITIVDYERRNQRYLQLIQASNITDRNKQIINQFYDFQGLEGISLGRRNKYLETLRIFAVKLNRDFDKCKVEDIKSLIRGIEDSDYSAWTKYTLKCIIKRFYKWLRGNRANFSLCRRIRDELSYGIVILP